MKYVILLFTISIYNCHAAGNANTDKTKVILCIGCHEADGNSNNPLYPKLAGQGQAYLAKQLRDFKSGLRKEEHMTSMVEAIAAEDIDDIAAYFSRQQRRVNKNNSTSTAAGKQLYNHGSKLKGIPACASCHGSRAQGITEKKTPLLAGQHKKYIVKMLHAFQNHERHNDADKQMREIAEKMNYKEIEIIADYIAGLR